MKVIRWQDKKTGVVPAVGRGFMGTVMTEDMKIALAFSEYFYEGAFRAQEVAEMYVFLNDMLSEEKISPNKEKSEICRFSWTSAHSKKNRINFNKKNSAS
jgi:hypothetical protein